METTQRLRQAITDYRNGETEAFTVLYEESSKYIYTSIYTVMKGNDNAQDIVSDIMQDTYVEVSRNLNQLENEESFLVWAGRIATRKSYAYLKKNKRYVLLAEEDDMFDNLSDSDNMIPEEVMQDREKQRLVREIIEKKLTEMQKLCIIAYYYNEQKQSEIAKELGIPENTVKTNLYRAKAQIKDGVLELEKKSNTKLYSVAPLLLLLFREDVEAANVPQKTTEAVLSAVASDAGAVSMAAGVSAKAKIAGKTAAVSLKTKLIAGIATVVLIGAVGGAAYIAGKNANNDKTEAETDHNRREKETEAVEEPVTKEIKQDDVAISSEERACFEILSEYMLSAYWDEETVNGGTIQPDEYAVCSFIQMLAGDNYSEEGTDRPYDAYLPERTEDGVHQNAYTSQSIQDYSEAVFGISLTDMEDYFTFENGLYMIENVDLLYTRKSEVERVDIDGDIYHVSGIITFGDGLDKEEYGEYMESYLFDMTLKKDENSPIGFVFQSLTYEMTEFQGQDVEEDNSDDGWKEDDSSDTTDTQDDIYLLSGTFSAKGGREELWFFEDGTVQVYEGGENTRCSYSIDAEGNIIIYANSENLEGKYYPDKDKVTFYGTNYYRE